MTATKNLHSASETRRSTELHQLARQLYALISSGDDGLAFAVGAGGPALIERTDGRVQLKQLVYEDGGARWQRAKELQDGVEQDRRFNPWVLEKHLRGAYAVAPAANGWVAWAAIDIDAHQRSGESELDARRRAKRVLGEVWRALGCSSTRHPLLLRSPGGGYHLYLPLTRGEGASNDEHTWPARIVRAWVEWHLVQAGLELAPGAIEVYPSGRCLRAPCGRGMVLLQATQPDEPNALGLAPWPGTAAVQVDWQGEDDELTRWSRLVAPTARAFLEQWGAQRRTLADWLGRPEAAWDPRWACLGWRDGEDVPRWGEIFTGEKNSVSVGGGEESQSQELDDVPGRPQAGGPMGGLGRKRGAGRSPGSQRPAAPINDNSSPTAQNVDPSVDSAGGRLVRGRAFFHKVKKLLLGGVTEASTRYDAVLTLTFYWAATCGLSAEETLGRLEAWCLAHLHLGSRLASRPRAFLRACMREAQHYLDHSASRWRFRARGGHAGGLGTLRPVDRVVVAAVEPRVAGEVATLLAWLAARADGTGRVADPVQISHGLLERLCGDRRVDVDGDGTRHRAATVALTELERIGVLTLARNYRVGKRGRIWSCWYQFGSGELPRASALPAAKWEEITPFRSTPLAPTRLEIVPSAPEGAPGAPVVEVRVLGERVVPEGLLRVISDGARGLPRTLFSPAPGIDKPTAGPAVREPWWERHYGMLSFTPGRLWAANAATVMAERRKLSRADRLDLGGGGRDGSGAAGASLVTLGSTAAAVSTTSRQVAMVLDPVVGSAGVPSGGGIVVPLGTPPAGSGAVTGPSSSTAVPPPSAAIAASAAPPEPRTAVPPTQAPSRSLIGADPGEPSVGGADRGVAEILAAGERSESALRAELADLTDPAFAAACDVDLLETLCAALSSFRGRGRGS